MFAETFAWWFAHKKITMLVRCLCRLHNYCINERLGNHSAGQEVPTEVSAPSVDDLSHIMLNGGDVITNIDHHETTHFNNETDRVEGMLDGGNHHDDHTYCEEHQFEIDNTTQYVMSPREKMLARMRDDYGCTERPSKKHKK